MSSGEALSSLIALIYEAALEPGRWPAFLQAYAEAVLADATAFLYHDFRNPHGAISVSFRLDPESQRLYAEHFGQIDPWIAGARAKGGLRPGIVHLGEELIARGDFVRTEYYNGLAKPFGLTRTLAGVIQGDRTAMASITALRSDATEPFGESQRRLNLQLMPHLQRALQIHRRIQGLELSSQAITDALDRLQSAVLIAGGDGTILYENKAAAELIANSDGLTSRGQRLRASGGAEDRQLGLLIREAAFASAGQATSGGGSLRLSRPSLRRPLSVLVAPMRLPQRGPFDDVRGLAAVFVADPEAHAAESVENLQKLWALTSTEARIARALACGENLREIAKRHAIAVTTVRWHVKHILAKTETRSQVELVRLLAIGTFL